MNPHQMTSHSEIGTPRGGKIRDWLVNKTWLAVVLLALIIYTWDQARCQTEEAAIAGPGVQVLTRGPVHEAFAGMLTFNPTWRESS